MADGNDIIRTADICDDHGDAVLICEIPFNDYAARNHFHGQVVTFATYEDNKGIRDVLAEAATWDDTVLRLEVEDQAHSHELLRRGETLAAVTSDPEPVQGCSVEPLGTMRYLAAAAPALLERSGSREPDWSRMPVVVFNAKDTLQHDLLAQELGERVAPPTHRVPTSADFLEALALGLGWGMVPETQLLPLERAGRLARLAPDRHVDVPLHWQRWRLDSLLLGRVTEAVRRAASAHLRR